MVTFRQEEIKKTLPKKKVKKKKSKTKKKKKKRKEKKRKKIKNYQDLSRSILSQLIKFVVEFTSLSANILPFKQYSK